MNLRRLIPQAVIQRARLAFLALGILAVVLAWTQLALIAQASGIRGWAFLAVAALLLSWIRLYRTGRPALWTDLLAAGATLVYLAALPLPDLGLSIVYVAVYMGALYGSRAESARAIVLIIAAYVGTEIGAGALESEIIRLFMFFQLPALLVTGAIIRALHESLLAQESLANRVEELIRMEAVIRLTGGIAHDFNNLLTTILGSLDLALDELDCPDELREDLGRARTTTLSARSLTSRLLSFSRTGNIAPEEIHLDTHIRSMESTLASILGPQIDLQIFASSEDAIVFMDPDSLEQVMRQLVQNARDALDEGTSDGTEVVTVRSGRCESGEVPPMLLRAESGPGPEKARFVYISVEDSGPGIPPEIRARAFEPFFSTRDGGRGLGLSTVYGIVTRAGGQVVLDESPAGGAEVTVFLPIHGTALPPDANASNGAGEETIASMS